MKLRYLPKAGSAVSDIMTEVEKHEHWLDCPACGRQIVFETIEAIPMNTEVPIRCPHCDDQFKILLDLDGKVSGMDGSAIL